MREAPALLSSISSEEDCCKSSENSASSAPRVEEIPEGRPYRGGGVKGRKLPTQLVRATGLLTHQGTPRDEWVALSVAAHLQAITSASEVEAIRYRNRHTGTQHLVSREAGTFVKSRQSFAEDIRQRIYKRVTAPGDGERRAAWDAGFRRCYDRLRHAMGRLEKGDYLSNEGAAIGHENKLARDLNGRRWSVPEAFEDLPEGREQRPYVRGAGPEPEIGWNAPHIDVLDALERMVAHRKALHKEFTHSWKQQKRGGQFIPPRPKHARKSHGWIAKNGADGPRFISVGRWQEEEIHRDDLKGRRALTVPWITADIDGSSWRRSDELARRLCQILGRAGADLSDVVVSYTGGRGYHVRIPHSMVGCPIYRDAAAARKRLAAFFRRLCSSDAELLEAIDFSACSPSQQIRMIGSAREDGSRCVAATGAEFLALAPIVLRAHSEAGAFTPFALPNPDVAAWSPALAKLLKPRGKRRQARGSGKASVAKRRLDGQSAGVIGRVRGGVGEASKWGRDVDRPRYVGRNWAAFIYSLYLCQRSPTPWADLRAWNRRCAPPLDVSELRRAFESARRRAG